VKKKISEQAPHYLETFMITFCFDILSGLFETGSSQGPLSPPFFPLKL